MGLTGGIGSGKSTAAHRFAAVGVPVIDADRIARSLCAPTQSAFAEIVAAFGPDVVGPDGLLDRARLRSQVFAHESARQQLEAILHPLVRAEMLRQVATLQTPYAILAVPLLIEGGMVDLVDRVLIVDCSEETQIQRVVQRDAVSRDQVEAVLRIQSTRSARRARADDILSNDADLASLCNQVDAMHQKYLTWAAVGCTIHYAEYTE